MFLPMVMHGLVILQVQDCAVTWQWDQMMVEQTLYGEQDFLIMVEILVHRHTLILLGWYLKQVILFQIESFRSVLTPIQIVLH
ncbi:Uncharacterised protein [Mycobacteroides abscessus]|nr:Uncharacterised protein [Mycobacteroides abscessus]